MTDLDLSILGVWNKLKKRLLNDPAELQRRLARRRTPSLLRPPRAWCLAIRASDQRINEFLGHSPHPTPHDLYVDSHLLRELCSSITVAGEMCDEVAQKLGTTCVGLRDARISGLLRSRYVPRLEGRRGRPIPIIDCHQRLDPNARGFTMSDPAWYWSGNWLLERLPDDFAQYLTRVPAHRPFVARRYYDDHAHPETLDSLPSIPRKRIPPPPPDPVWYKWSTKGEFLGNDPRYWRKTPDDPGTPPETPTAEPWALKRRRRRRSSHPRCPSGSLVFHGWNWVCPKCFKTVRTLYLPLPPVNLLEDPMLPVTVDELPLRKLLAGAWKIEYVGEFACADCHRVKFFSRASGDAWNELISALTGGLLYGREVPKPADFQPLRRRRPYHPQLNRPAPRRQRVLELLLEGKTISQIAHELGIRPCSVHNHRHKLYRQHGVHTQQELAKKLGVTLPNPARDRAMRLENEIIHYLLDGLESSQIAAVLRLSIDQVNYRVKRIYRAHNVHGRAELKRKLKSQPALSMVEGMNTDKRRLDPMRIAV